MGVSGHLATVTSYEENWWIVENLGGELTLDRDIVNSCVWKN
jgi:hypothetical protein